VRFTRPFMKISLRKPRAWMKPFGPHLGQQASADIRLGGPEIERWVDGQKLEISGMDCVRPQKRVVVEGRFERETQLLLP